MVEPSRRYAGSQSGGASGGEGAVDRKMVRSDLTSGLAVDRVSHPGGAVVPVIVVVIEAVHGQRIPRKELLQLQPGARRQIELLHPHRAVVSLVLLEVLLGGKSRHPVPHLPPREAEDEVLLAEVEQTVVVGEVGSLHRIVDPDGVVAEPLPDPRPGSHGHHEDGQLRAGLSGASVCLAGGGRRNSTGGAQQAERQPPERRAGAIHSWTSRPSSAER